MKCPVCRKSTGYYQDTVGDDPSTLHMFEYPLYQFSYPGSKDYISPRCSACIDVAIQEKSSTSKVLPDVNG